MELGLDNILQDTDHGNDSSHCMKDKEFTDHPSDISCSKQTLLRRDGPRDAQLLAL